MHTNNDGKKFEFPLFVLLLLLAEPNELLVGKVEGRQRSTMKDCSVGDKFF